MCASYLYQGSIDPETVDGAFFVSAHRLQIAKESHHVTRNYYRPAALTGERGYDKDHYQSLGNCRSVRGESGEYG
jgi:hypothetical protein